MTFDPSDEQALLVRARLHDVDALALIFDTYYKMIFRYIYVRVGHVQTSEDLAAQVFQRLLAHAPDQHLKAWLFRVAENLIIDDVRRSIHRNHAPLDEDMIASSSLDQADPIALDRLRAALDRLTPIQRQSVTLRYLFEMPNEDIAQVMNLSVGAVKAHVHRGLIALRGWLKETTHESQ